MPQPPDRASWDDPKVMDYHIHDDLSVFSPDSDVYAVLVKGIVSVTPLSLDMTSRADLGELEKGLREQMG